MVRVVNPDSTGKERTRLTKSIVLTIRELAKHSAPSTEARDMAAFIALALEQVAAGIEVSTAAWEKRGYWLKADRFRLDWEWAGKYSGQLRAAVLDDDWSRIAQIVARTAEHLSRVQVAPHNRLGAPWVGAFAALDKARSS